MPPCSAPFTVFNSPFTLPFLSSCLRRHPFSLVINLEFSQLFWNWKEFWSTSTPERRNLPKVLSQLILKPIKNLAVLDVHRVTGSVQPCSALVGLLEADFKGHAQRGLWVSSDINLKICAHQGRFSYTEYEIFQESYVCFIYSVWPLTAICKYRIYLVCFPWWLASLCGGRSTFYVSHGFCLS